jgi:hypothetical protein
MDDLNSNPFILEGVAASHMVAISADLEGAVGYKKDGAMGRFGLERFLIVVV